jgi:hypothetical protein
MKTRMSVTRPATLVGALVVAALGADAGRASRIYPGLIADHVGGPAPVCNLCHQSPGGGGPVVTAFANAMVGAGLTGGGNDSALFAALDALDGDGTDSDGDGTGDVDELRAGTDPNAADGGGGPVDQPPTPGYGFGCAAGPAGTTTSVSLLDLAPAAALAFVLGRRRRR